MIGSLNFSTKLYITCELASLIVLLFPNPFILFSLPGYPLLPGQSPWDIEAYTRDTMSILIRNHINGLSSNAKPNAKIMVVMADLDEIPAHHTVSLLKNCDFGSSIHLQLRDYLYRFVQSILRFNIKVNMLNGFSIALNGTLVSLAGVRVQQSGIKTVITGIQRVENAFLPMRVGTVAIASDLFLNTSSK